MIGGTSGSETKFCQPDASQSKSTQTRSFSLGSRNTVEPLEPCCFRFSAPLVEKVFRKRSKSSTFVVAKIICFPLSLGCVRQHQAVAIGAPPGLGPELVPGVEVFEVLTTV